MTESTPPPSFDQLPLNPDTRKALTAMGYVHPTPVQLSVYEPAVRGKNLVVQARTGTGKTTAFGLPLIDALIRKSATKTQALIMTPTRELALQVSAELEKLGQFRGVRVTAIYGGAPMGPQVEALQSGVHIVVGTPGRLLDHISRGTFDVSETKFLVLDEADELLSMGFARELTAIVDSLPKERQGLFFSATIPPDIERLARDKLRDPEFVTLSSDQVGALTIEHNAYMLPSGDKRRDLIRILEVENPESAVIFCNTRDETERVAEVLKAHGFDADWLNGDLEQRERERVMGRIREGKLRFLVATDVAARGIDISHLTHVINHDFPEHSEGYVHRTGRTGRAGRTGTAISLVTPKDVGNLYLVRLLYKIRPFERMLPSAGELKTRAELDVLAFFQEAYASRETHPDDLAMARRLMTHSSAEHIIGGLLRDHLGARPEAKEHAAEARRAKNPTPAAAIEPRLTPAPVDRQVREPRDRGRTSARRPQTARPFDEAQAGLEGAARKRAAEGPSSDSPLTLGTGQLPPTARGNVRKGAPHTTYTEWEPPLETDDDRPILRAAHVTSTTPRDGGQTGATRDTIQPDAADAPARPSSEDAVATDATAHVFINVGRRDRVQSNDIEEWLIDAGLTKEDIAGIRVRDRMTFVDLRTDHVDRVVTAVSGKQIGTRRVNAERARVRV